MRAQFLLLLLLSIVSPTIALADTTISQEDSNDIAYKKASLSHSNECSLVLIHLGPHIPSHVFIALKQARLFNKKIPIYFIGESSSLNDAEDEFKKLNIIPVNTNSLKLSRNHKRFKRQFQNKNIFIYATERFFYLQEFLTQYNHYNIFHIENDTMIYLDLKKELHNFKKNYPNIAAIFDNDERAVPNFMYIAHPHALDDLLPLLETFPHKEMYDMQIIGYFGQSKGERAIGHLPIIMPEYHEDFELISPHGKTTKTPELFYKKYSVFQSIFDGAAIGQYLGGLDPVHGTPQPGFISEACIFNASYLTFTWIKDNKNRKIPYAIYKGKNYKINNLHIHSKRLEDFAS